MVLSRIEPSRWQCRSVLGSARISSSVTSIFGTSMLGGGGGCQAVEEIAGPVGKPSSSSVMAVMAPFTAGSPFGAIVPCGAPQPGVRNRATTVLTPTVSNFTVSLAVCPWPDTSTTTPRPNCWCDTFMPRTSSSCR